MKNLKLILGLIFLISNTLLFSNDKNGFKNEFHINSTGFVANYLNFGNNVSSNNPYLLGYKRIVNNSAYRVGLMGNISNSNSIVNPQQPRLYINNQSLYFRIGYEWRKNIHNKWSVFYGFDFATDLNDNKSISYQNVNLNGNIFLVKNNSSFSNYSYGGGPIGGIQWNLTNRLSLMAESRAYFFYTEVQSKNKWEDIPEQLRINGSFADSDNVNYFTRLNLNLPLDIFLIIKF